MKKLFILGGVILFSAVIYAQDEIGEHRVLIDSIEPHDNHLLINQETKLVKGDTLDINLPTEGRSFSFIKKMTIAATAVGVTTSASKSNLVKDQSVADDPNAISGKKLIVNDWIIENGAYLIQGIIGGTTYLIDLKEASNSGEVSLKKPSTKLKTGPQTDSEIMQEIMEKYKGRF